MPTLKIQLNHGVVFLINCDGAFDVKKGDNIKFQWNSLAPGGSKVVDKIAKLPVNNFTLLEKSMKCASAASHAEPGKRKNRKRICW